MLADREVRAPIFAFRSAPQSAIGVLVLLELLWMIRFALVAALLAPAALAAAEPSKAEDPLDKVRCKRQTETGSLAKVTKICRTERQWRAISEGSKRETRQMLDTAGSQRTSG